MTQEEYNNKREEILEDFICELDDSSIVAFHNAYCDRNGDPDSIIYVNDEENFNMVMSGKEPYDVALELEGANYHTNDDYVVWGCYGPTSFDNPYDKERSPLCISDIIDECDADDIMMMLRDACIDYDDMKEALDELDSEWETESAKQDFKDAWEKMLQSKSPMFTFPNGDYCYINYDEDADTLETGSACNAGFCRDYRSVSIEVEYDETLDYNLEGLYDAMTEENPELLEEPEENEND